VLYQKTTKDKALYFAGFSRFLINLHHFNICDYHGQMFNVALHPDFRPRLKEAFTFFVHKEIELFLLTRP
jgi:hypothetical protein